MRRHEMMWWTCGRETGLAVLASKDGFVQPFYSEFETAALLSKGKGLAFAIDSLPSEVRASNRAYLLGSGNSPPTRNGATAVGNVASPNCNSEVIPGNSGQQMRGIGSTQALSTASQIRCLEKKKSKYLLKSGSHVYIRPQQQALSSGGCRHLRMRIC